MSMMRYIPPKVTAVGTIAGERIKALSSAAGREGLRECLSSDYL